MLGALPGRSGARLGAAARRPDARRRRPLPPRAGRRRRGVRRRRSCASAGWSTRSRGAAASTGARSAALECERVAAAAIDGGELRALAAARDAAGGLGLARALVELASELEEQRVDAGASSSRCARGRQPSRPRGLRRELGALYGGYRDRLARAGPRRRAAAHRAGARRAARAARPLGRTPVFLYGFDELHRAPARRGRDARPAARRVTVSLTYEAGRAVFSARGGDLPGARGARRAEHTALPALRRHYAAASREPLHHLERELFESDLEPAPLFGPASAPTVDPRRRDRAAARRRPARRGRARRGDRRAADARRAATRPRRSRSSFAAPRRGPLVARALRRGRDRVCARRAASPRAAPRSGAA